MGSKEISRTQGENSQRLFDRDLSWLSFNYRVLLEATDPNLPVYERIKFLAIYSSNNGEFFQVRVAPLQSLSKAKKKNPDGFLQNPDQRLEQIFIEVHRQQEVFGKIFRQQILPALAEQGIHLILGKPEQAVHREFVQRYFDEEMKPFLHPELLRKGKIMHFLRDNALYHAVKLHNRPSNWDKLSVLEKELFAKKKKGVRYALIQIPTHYFPRFVELPQVDGKYYYMFLDDILRCNLDRIFPGYDILACHSIKLNRNAEITIEDEFDGNLVDKMRISLKKRRVGIPARFLYDKDMPVGMLTYLRDTFHIRKRELMGGGAYHSYSHFFSFPNPVAPALERTPTPPLIKSELQAYDNIFDAIRSRNWLLHFPYHTYDHVIRFLNQAASDPKVEEIYTTQYRVASDSAIVGALIRAAENGKKVTVFVEIKARFDEQQNIQTAEAMKKAGVATIHSIPGLKVHAKVAMVRRREEGELKGYTFLSTGNFNEKTARIYTDQGYFTDNPAFIAELSELFEHLQDRTYSPKPFRHLLVGFFGMRERYLALIDREILNARAGKPASLFIKINNLEDAEMIEKLYEASEAGVQIRMIVRGICRLRPGVPGMSANIDILRLVDQFLEHSRIFLFENAGQEELYLGSADWMGRNLRRRIEVAFPLQDPQLKAEVKAIMELQWADNVKGVHLNQNLENLPIDNDRTPVRAQMEIYARIRDGRLLDPIPGK